MDQTSDFLNHLTGTVSGDDRLRYFSEAGELKDGTKAGYKTLDEIFQAMKGYKEYTFAIRQSGTSAPVVTVVKDDLNLENPISFTRNSAGLYRANYEEILYKTSAGRKFIFPQQAYTDLTNYNITRLLTDSANLVIYTGKLTGFTGGVPDITNQDGLLNTVISIIDH